MNERQDCVYTRTLSARLDLGQTHQLFEHIRKCTPCKESYTLREKAHQKIEQSIPFAEISLREQEEILFSSQKILENIQGRKQKTGVVRGLLKRIFN